MFDFRYHVASLAAVFVALVLGILVGVGVSSNDTLSNSERKLLNEQKAELQARYTALAGQLNALQDEQRAASAFSSVAYASVMHDRLKGKRLGIVFVGPSDARLRSLVEGALTDANGVSTPLPLAEGAGRPGGDREGDRVPPGPRGQVRGDGRAREARQGARRRARQGRQGAPLGPALQPPRGGAARRDARAARRRRARSHGAAAARAHRRLPPRLLRGAGLGRRAARRRARRRTRRSRRRRSSASSASPASTTCRLRRAGSRSPRCSPARSPATTASTRPTTRPSCRRSPSG